MITDECPADETAVFSAANLWQRSGCEAASGDGGSVVQWHVLAAGAFAGPFSACEFPSRQPPSRQY